MKILIDARFIAGGAKTHLLGILKNLNKNFKYILLVNTDLAKTIYVHNINVELVVFKKNTFYLKIFWYLILRAVKVKNLKPDLLICLSGINVYSPCRTVALFQNMLPFETKVYKFYNLFGRLRLKFFKYLYLQSFRQSELVICLSKHARNVLLDHFIDLKKLQIVGHGLAVSEHYKTPKSINEKKLKLVYVSNWHPYKYTDFLFGDYDALSKDVIIELDLIGGGCQKCIHYIKDNISRNTHKNVKINYIGELSFNELQKILLNKYDGAIFASRCENSPNIVLEYISAGLPILFTNYPSVDELITNKELVFSATNESFTNILHKLIDMDSNKRFIIAKENLNNVKNLSWAEVSNKFWSLIGNI